MKLTLATLAVSSLAVVSAQNVTNNIVQNVQALNSTAQSGKNYGLGLALKLASGLQPIVDALTATDKNITLFAPTDAAFTAFQKNPAALGLVADPAALTNVLRYHTVGAAFLPAGQPAKQFVNTGYNNNYLRVDVQGEKVTVYFTGGNATVIDSIPSSNGIIHVIDSVLVPPPSAADAAKAAGLTKLVESVVASNLTSAVADLNNATLFAPTDAAFETVLSFAKSNGVDVNATTLQGILRFHVVPGVKFSTDLVKNKTAELASLLDGEFITATVDGDDIKLTGKGQVGFKLQPAKVSKADVLVKGGVVHVIDAVLLPDLTKASTPAIANVTTPANSDKKSAASKLATGSFVSALAAVGAFAILA